MKNVYHAKSIPISLQHLVAQIITEMMVTVDQGMQNVSYYCVRRVNIALRMRKCLMFVEKGYCS